MTAPGTALPAGVDHAVAHKRRRRPYWTIAAVCALLALGAYFRFLGRDWGEGKYLHPDERFVIWVTSDLAPAASWSDYFDTKKSTLNPHNRGHSFFVYGTLPPFAIRYLTEWIHGKSGFGEVAQVGRTASALADLFAALLVYLLGARLFGRTTGLLALFLYSAAVLPIQLSHYFKEDTFASTFCLLALYCAIRVGDGGKRDLLWSCAWGLAAACAAASKLNAAAILLTWPVALALRGGFPQGNAKAWLKPSLAAAASFLLAFRLFQPYAFTGPGLFDISLNPAWLANLREVWAQSSGVVDFPPALQWARRPIWFAVQNLAIWGLGPPLGFLSLIAVLWSGWRVIHGDWRRYGLLFGWAVLVIGMNSRSFNPTMRYLLPAYPALAILAACASNALIRRGGRFRSGGIAVVCLVILTTSAWAFAFTRIYTRPITRIQASRWILANVPGPIQLKIDQHSHPLAFGEKQTLASEPPFETDFEATGDGTLSSLTLNEAACVEPGSGCSYKIRAEIFRAGALLGYGSAQGSSGATTVALEPQVRVQRGERYHVKLQIEKGPAVRFAGASVANESSWDDALPMPVDGTDPFGGIYRGLNLEMYWDDNPEKLARLRSVLDQADYLFISSNRQWASVTRLPERYPLSTLYYRELLGCPPDKDVVWCYQVAEPGSFRGKLGFELVQVFESYPNLGSWRFNDQFAEEAFSVYDHPKVLIFRKTAGFTAAAVEKTLSRVDLSQVVHILPSQAGRYPANLMLPADLQRAHAAGGTWAELFDPAALVNRSQLAAVIAWYLALALAGWFGYLLLRLPFGGLADRGYPVMRTAGLLIVSYLVWLAASSGFTFSRGLILGTFAGLGVAAIAAAWLNGSAVAAELRERRSYFLAAEALFLLVFLFALTVRWANPDLWHPWRGGEKPMDFSIYNAVLKSSFFPPYDPWFAGGYLNYYYFGFVLFAVPAKALGIQPAIAFNLVMASLFALIAAGAFSLGWNLAGAESVRRRFAAGAAAAIAMAVAGNLGAVKLFIQGCAKLAAPGVDESSSWHTIVSAFRGLFKLVSGASLPIERSEWYWSPSRAIPALIDAPPITEFPYFTFLQADPHAHAFALPIALLGLTAATAALLFGKLDRNIGRFAALAVFGALCAGTLRVTNTWDFYPYLFLTFVAFGYCVWRGTEGVVGPRLAASVAVGGAVAVAAAGLYSPFFGWYGSAYGVLEAWRGSRTPLSAYLTHWGLFLFILTSWLAVETYRWMAHTPMRELRHLSPYSGLAWFASVVLVGALILLQWSGVEIAWLAVILIAWSATLAVLPGIPLEKRGVMCAAAFALALTLAVEVLVLRGDIGRMNTVFKVYLQAWTLLSVAAGYAVTVTLAADARRLGPVWRTALGVLAAGALLYPVAGTAARVRDRMVADAPNTLDGTAFLAAAKYADGGIDMDLSKDYAAIQWMQRNVKGSPVIVEANLRDLYRWGSRFSVYTGLPGVVGWEWHQQQQRSTLPREWVSRRIDEVTDFYSGTDVVAAERFLRKYSVRFIVVGQQERVRYPGAGLSKFEQPGVPWKPVYREGETAIYEVLQ